MEQVKPITLACLAVGAKAMVTKVAGRGAVSKRLMEMGVVPGVWIRVVKTAPFGDPIEVRLKGYNLAMRRNEAESIEVSQ